jgi:UDP-N-acetylmuramate: L-alanyl-gamma-D-glutamyl-meso-diaminopimelate ligase
MALMIGKKERFDVTAVGYKSHAHTSDNNGHFYLTDGKEKHPIKIFGSHNYQNISGAKEVLKKLGITNEQFYAALRRIGNVRRRCWSSGNCKIKLVHYFI